MNGESKPNICFFLGNSLAKVLDEEYLFDINLKSEVKENIKLVVETIEM